jgi:hypothetical protein
MRPAAEFSRQDPSFWAHVKLVSERLGYSVRRSSMLRVYTREEIVACLTRSSLATAHLIYRKGSPTRLLNALCAYFQHRANVLNTTVKHQLMNREEAKNEFERLCARGGALHCALPMNKQKGEKRHPAYLTCIVNVLTERALAGRGFVDSPRGLVVATTEGNTPLRTFSRWMDGAYPTLVNPHAVWEVKEYYGTTTFGSRVADGVYETMLDGHEFGELREHTGRRILHYLMIDDRYTWWDCGRSYLCRIIDMLHMGLVDEVLFGREVLKRWPEIVHSWP